jgi:hypothetical protein
MRGSSSVSWTSNLQLRGENQSIPSVRPFDLVVKWTDRGGWLGDMDWAPTFSSLRFVRPRGAKRRLDEAVAGVEAEISLAGAVVHKLPPM